jgi:hypothetical protein
MSIKKISFKDAIAEIKKLVMQSETPAAEPVTDPAPETPQEPAAPETPAEPASEPTAEPAAEPVTEEPKPSEFAEDKPKEPDYAAMQAEISDLKKKVQVLDEYLWLKQQHESLKGQVANMQTGFTQMIALVEQMAGEPQGEPIQEPKNTLAKKKSSIDKYCI